MEDFIRVSTAKARYFGGAMSLRWWYRLVEEGRLPHFRVGGAVLLRPVDVEAFVTACKREPEPTAPESEEPAAGPRPRSALARGGLRFFTS